MDRLKTFTLIFSIWIVSSPLVHAQWEDVALDTVNFEQIVSIDENTLIGKGQDKLYISYNNGQSWEYMESTPDLFYIRALAFNNGKLYLGSQFNKMMRVSADTGKTWQVKNNGMGDCTILDIYAKGNITIAATYQNGVYVSLDEGEHWYDKDTGINTNIVQRVAVTDSFCLASTSEGLYYSRDTADTWMLNSYFTDKLINAFYVKDSLVYATSDTNLYVSHDYGFTWEHMNIEVENSTMQIGPFNHIDSNDSLLFLGSRSQDIFSTDNGSTWYTPGIFTYFHPSYCSIINGDYVVTGSTNIQRAKISDFFIDTISIEAQSNKTVMCESDTLSVWPDGNNLFYYAIYQGSTYKRFNDTMVLNHVSADATGRYYIRGTNFRSEAIDSIDILISNSSVYATKDTSICPGEEMVLKGYNGINMSWSGGVINGQAFIPENTQDYYLHVFDTVCNSYVYDTTKITVYESPVPDLGVDTSISENGSVDLIIDTGFSSYIWNDDPLLNTNTFSVEAEDYGVGTYEFYVEVTDEHSCKGSDTILVGIDSVIDGLENLKTGNVVVYPVPFHNQLNIENPNELNGQVIIYTVSGQLVYIDDIYLYKNRIKIPEGNPGTYILEIRFENGDIFKKPLIRY